MYCLRLVFGTSERVRPRAYAASGFGLMLFKNLTEMAAIWLCTGYVLGPWQFLSPRIGVWSEILKPVPGAPTSNWLALALFLWTLPFLWISVTMSVRRMADAGQSPWLGLLVLVPLINLFVMWSLCFAPSATVEQWLPYRRDPSNAPALSPRAVEPSSVWPPYSLNDPDRTGYLDPDRGTSAAMAIGLSQVIGGLMLFVSVHLFSSYGASLFLGTPILMGAAAGYFYNRRRRRSYGSSVMVGLGSVFFAEGAMLMFALEGAICLIMAAPLLLPLGMMGGMIGKAIADATRRPSAELLAAILALPMLAGGEALLFRASERMVCSTVEIDGPPEAVWNNVVDFPELTEPPDWYFSWGIACPRRARIVGHGPGATRYCEFTTGTFVEPITHWDEPRRLAFDVAEQPDPMFELTPYRNVHPPHMEHSLRSTHGEFLLIALPDGRTRLEGPTWYRLEMWPQWYWTIWSDELIHRIHERVLEHIKRLSE
jgi:uncharacterized membrane protein YhaH (DUF805 family)